MRGSVGTIDFLADTNFGEPAFALEKLAFTTITIAGHIFVTLSELTSLMIKYTREK